MKLFRILAFVVAGLLVLAGLLTGLALMPAVQTWVAQRVLAGRPGIALQIGRVAAGLSSADLHDLRFVQNGLEVTAGDVSARYSLWDYLRRRQITLDQVTARGLVIDARKMTPASATPTAASSGHRPAAALALLTPLRLPVDLKLGRLNVDGRALLAGGRSVTFSANGGGIAPGEKGRIEWKVRYADATVTAPLRGLHAAGALDLHLTADRRVDRLEIENTATAVGPQLPSDQFRVQLTAAQPAPSAAETCTLQIALMRQGRTERLLDSHLDYQPAKRKLEGTWNLAVRSEQFSALLAAFGLPETALQGSGRFSVQGPGATADVQGRLNGTVADLRSLGPQFAAVGPVRLQATFDAGLAGGVARVTQLGVDITNAKGGRLLRVATSQPVSFNVAERRLLPLRAGTGLAQIEIDGLPLVWAQPVVKPVTIEAGQVSGALSIAADADGRQARLRTIRPLTLTGVTLRDSGKLLVQGMGLSVNPQVDYSASGIDAEITDCRLTLPAGDEADARISARLTHVASVPVVAFSVQTRERLVSVLRPFLKFDPGPLALESSTEGRWEGRRLHLTRMNATVKTGRGSLVAAVESLQPVTVDLESERLTAENSGKPAARIRVGELPLAVAQAYVPHSVLRGGLAGAAFEVALPSRDSVALRTTTPVRFHDVSVTLDGRELVRGLDGTADFAAATRGGSVTAEVRQFEVSREGTSLLSLKGTGEVALGASPIVSAKGQLQANLAALEQQPALAGSAAISRGLLDTRFEVTTGSEIQARAGLTIRNLVGSGSQSAPVNLDLKVDAAVKPDGSQGTVRVPLTLTVGNRRSDLSLDGRFERAASKLSFAGSLTSNLIVVDDFRALAALVPTTSTSPAGPATGASRSSPSAATTAGATSRPARSAAAPATTGTVAAGSGTAPFWAGFSGRFDANLKKVQYGPTYTIRGLQGAMVATADRLALDNLQGQYKDRPFTVTGAVTFAPGESQPYGMTGRVDVSGFDVGAFLRAADPGQPPAMESTISIRANVNGRGATPDDLAQNVRGQIDVAGSKGMLRALGRRGELAGAASTVLGLFGAIRGSDTTVAVGQLAGMLKEMPFDKFSARVERGANLNLELVSLEFVSPAVHLTGRGSVQYQKGVPITAQPLRVQLQLAGKQQMAVVLNRLKMLSGRTDAQGYYLMSTPFVVTGTLAKPDSGQLWKIVGETAAKEAVGRLLR